MSRIASCFLILVVLTAAQQPQIVAGRPRQQVTTITIPRTHVVVEGQDSISVANVRRVLDTLPDRGKPIVADPVDADLLIVVSVAPGFAEVAARRARDGACIRRLALVHGDPDTLSAAILQEVQRTIGRYRDPSYPQRHRKHRRR